MSRAKAVVVLAAGTGVGSFISIIWSHTRGEPGNIRFERYWQQLAAGRRVFTSQR